MRRDQTVRRFIAEVSTFGPADDYSALVDA